MTDDVCQAEETDGWSTPPFKFSHDQASGRMYGRGVTDDKGPVMGWINVIQAFQSAGVPLPVNLLFCLEGLEEVGSFDLEEILRSEISKGREGLLPSFDAVCISDTYWLGTTKPCLSYGLRGINFFILEISSGSKVDKHSGLGGTVQEPLNDLFRIYASMTNENGDINMPGVLELAKPLSERERTLYQGIDYELGAEAKHATTMEHLIALWHDPAISFHGIEGAFWGPGGKTIIPGCVKGMDHGFAIMLSASYSLLIVKLKCHISDKEAGKFSIRISSTMDPSAVAHAVEAHVANISNALDTKNTITLTLLGSQRGWQSNPFHWNFEAAEKATVKVWGTKPDYTREGGTIPITRMLADILSNGGRERETDEREKEPTNIMLFPMGRADDGAHSTNEKLDLVNYINGCKAFAWYLNEVGEMFREKRA
ncbi:hypothetical protein AJ79_01068 [Helicocarpus griseus UAMH5409]|uniref:Peptidase M20 dimerisation domain-containing protein n=1 Tax=Helicocarpus griseus UAMH5409 TaxID=1447875 RepID=A0A2B7Y974_9EURO|nr:hypothetical protein AJ79_01068 [Helicocarpus griseus UAMH5409]